jgi:tRNA (Thr-GGU) A37 N-methylase
MSVLEWERVENYGGFEVKSKKRHPRSFQDYMTDVEVILLRNFGETLDDLDDLDHHEIIAAWNHGISAEELALTLEEKNHLERFV